MPGLRPDDAGDGGERLPVTARFTAQGSCEVWDRRFGDISMHTVHAVGSGGWQGLLVERVGRLTFGFRVTADARGLYRELPAGEIRGMPIPRFAAPTIHGTESVQNGRFHFDVTMDLPLIGRVVHYAGWLEPTTG